MASFGSALMSTGFSMVGFSPIASVLVPIFDASPLVVNLCVLVYLIMFVPMNFISFKLLHSIGMRGVLLLSAGLVIVGAWMRMLVMTNERFLFVLIGSVPMAAA